MVKTELSHDTINTQHRAKWAYVYLRQSSPGQVLHHQESTETPISVGEPGNRLGLAARAD